MGLEEVRKLKQAAEEKPLPKYGSIRRVSDKREKKLQEQIEVSKKDDEFYARIWRERKHECYECQKPLGNTFKRWFAHHAIPKSQYPEHRHNPDNLILLCLEDHSKAETNQDFCPRVKAYTQLLKDNLGI